MCKEVEKVLDATDVNEASICAVNMNGEEHASEDFVCVLSRENGDASLFYNTDAITIGMAIRMLARALVDMLNNMPEEERESVKSFLGDIFTPGSAQEEATDE